MPNPRWLLLFAVTGFAAAHELRDVRATLDRPSIQGLVVELHQTAPAPQIVVANRGQQVLEILDASGHTFVRIAPGASRGWIDPRLSTGLLAVPKAVREQALAEGREVRFAEWEIPARIGSRPLKLRGDFLYVPPAEGGIQSVLLTPPPAGIDVQVASGAIPALMVRSKQGETVEVLDAQGRAFIRIGRDGASADTGNPAWLAANTGAAVRGAGWQRISRAPSATWIEPRAGLNVAAATDAPKRWKLPLRVGDRLLTLEGESRWVSAACAREWEKRPKACPKREGAANLRS